jgi:rare lipoprotein A
MGNSGIRRLALSMLALGALTGTLTGCRSTQTIPGAEPVRERPAGHAQRGVASWYGPQFHGRRTANGEIYDMHGLTAAHRTLPFDTWVRVTNLDNGRSVDLRINDRGPFVKGRVLDVSYAAAQRLGMVGTGTAPVEIRVLDVPLPPEPAPVAARRFTVQLGAFESKDRARRLRAEVARSHPDAVVRAGGGWYRVQVGRFDTRDAAERVLMELTRAGYTALVRAVP